MGWCPGPAGEVGLDLLRGPAPCPRHSPVQPLLRRTLQSVHTTHGPTERAPDTTRAGRVGAEYAASHSRVKNAVPLARARAGVQAAGLPEPEPRAQSRIPPCLEGERPGRGGSERRAHHPSRPAPAPAPTPRAPAARGSRPAAYLGDRHAGSRPGWRVRGRRPGSRARAGPLRAGGLRARTLARGRPPRWR